MKRLRWPEALIYCWYIDGKMTVQEIADRLCEDRWQWWWRRQGVDQYRPAEKVLNCFLRRRKFPLRSRGAKGARNANWKGGRHSTGHGYFQVYAPDHPRCNKRGYVLEHRLVMEKKIGRYLEPQEVVHHIDDNPSNNCPDNLQLFPNNAEHISKTLSGRPADNTHAVAGRKKQIADWWRPVVPTVLRWYNDDQLTQVQIASLLGVDRSTVRNQILQAGHKVERRNWSRTKPITDRHRREAAAILETPHPDTRTCAPKCT